MSTAAHPDPQVSIYETVIDNPDVEQLLETRDTVKTDARAANKAAREADAAAKAALETLDLADAPVRIGRFVVALKETAGKTVAFETAPGTRWQIKTLGED